MATNYWTEGITARRSRRRFLASTGGGLAATSLLVACGGGDKQSTSKDASGLLYEPREASGGARGGTITGLSNNILAFDTLGNAAASSAAAHAYSRLLKARVFKYPEKPTPSVDPDAAASFEVAPDGLTHTFKLRPNQKFDPRPPTEGRTLNSGDVVFSWGRFVRLNSFRTYLAASAAPSAPVESVAAPDAGTVVFKLNYPYNPFLPFLTWHRILAVMPVEADGKFDVKTDMRGSAAWRLKEYQGSAFVSYEPNPDWYDASKLKLAGATYYDLPDYSTQLAQFTAGKLALVTVNQDDILPTKRARPSLLLKRADRLKINQELIRFNYSPGSPFLDDRVRRAVSMLLDRDLIIETMNNTRQFTEAGLDIEIRWSTLLPPGEVWWMNPKGKEFGPDAKAFANDPAEAKKLMRAAGHTTPLRVPFALQTEASSAYEREGQIMAEMISSGGDFEAQFKLIDYNADWRPNYQFGSDKHPGMAYGFFRGGFPDADIPIQFFQKSDSQQGGHVAADGKPDTTLEGLIKRQQGEFDANKRAEIMKELQRYAAKMMYTVPGAGDSTRFELGQPWLANWGVYRTYLVTDGSPANEVFPYYFIDSSKA
jgi:ABC-type transport system substrate-binding protein